MTLKTSPAWKYFSLYIRKKNPRCYTCGKSGDYREFDGGHYFHNNSAMFFDERFVRTQCTGCNRFKHGNLGVYGEKLILEFGIDVMKKARRESTKLKRWKPKELKEIANKYKKLIELEK